VRVARILLLIRSNLSKEETTVSKILRGVAAGWGAKKSGCGCVGTVVVFIVLWILLGNFQIFQ